MNQPKNSEFYRKEVKRLLLEIIPQDPYTDVSKYDALIESILCFVVSKVLEKNIEEAASS